MGLYRASFADYKHINQVRSKLEKKVFDIIHFKINLETPLYVNVRDTTKNLYQGWSI